MKRAFVKVTEATGSPGEPQKHMKELVEQALLEVAHTVDSKFDSLHARREKLEA